MFRLTHWCTGRSPLGTPTSRDRGTREPAKFISPRAAAIATIAAALALISQGSLADEGGSSFWTPGSYASLSATPSQPGFSLTSVYYHPSVSFDTEVARANRFRTRRQSVDLFSEKFADADTVKDLAMVTPSYTFASPIFGAQATVGLTAVYGRNRTFQNVLLSDLAVGRSRGRARGSK